ncbi:MAG TPA: hypothetical protein VF788_17665, partial [Pseudonocardiaceae bacterium]
GFALLRSKGETSARQRRTESFRGRWLIATRPPTTSDRPAQGVRAGDPDEGAVVYDSDKRGPRRRRAADRGEC